MAAVVNVNNSHKKASKSRELNVPQQQNVIEGSSKSKPSTRVKSKVVIPQYDNETIDEMDFDASQTQTAQFEEDGELIQMEINDGGEAKRQFASDNEEDSQDNDSKQSDYDDEATQSDAESGELDSQTDKDDDPPIQFRGWGT